MCLNVSTRRSINLSCQGLIHEGFSLRGHYVGHRTDPKDERIQPFFRLSVKSSLSRRLAALSDCRKGEERIEVTRRLSRQRH